MTTPPPPLDAATRRNLLVILLEGMAVGLMMGLGESYCAAFALELGHSEVASGLAATLPLLGGALLQLCAPACIRSLRSHRRWVLTCASMQVGALVTLASAALRGSMGLPALFGTFSVYWAAGLSAGPAWTVWVEDLIPRDVRLRFFARRSLASQACMLAGLLGSGILLHAAGGSGRGLGAFAVIFLLAAGARLTSLWLLSMQPEAEVNPELLRLRSPRELLAPGAAGRDLVLYMALVQLTVNIAGPFFSPFMLRQLRLDYVAFATLFALVYLARVGTLQLVGRHGRGLKAHTLLWIGGISIVPLSASWIVSESYGYLVVVNFVSGAAWATYELATLLLFFEDIPPDRRASLLTLYNVAHSSAIVGGSTCGGLLLDLLGARRPAYHLLFALSSAGRALALLALRRVPASPAIHVAPLSTCKRSPRTDGSIHRPRLGGAGRGDAREEPGSPREGAGPA